MSDVPSRRFTTSDAVEILLGLALMLGAVATWSPRVAVGILGGIVFAAALWCRRTA